MKKLSFKEKLEIVRNIIRESLSGNAAFALLVYSLLHSLPIKTFADLFVTILLFIAIIAVVIWLFLIIYVYFCELFRFSEICFLTISSPHIISSSLLLFLNGPCIIPVICSIPV